MAESVASAAVQNVTNQAMTYASHYVRYFFCYGEIVQDFTNQRKTLESKIQRVEICVEGAERQNEVIYKDVENWLTRAKNELKETQNLQDEIDRKLAEKIPIISKLLETSNFAQVGYRGSLQGIEFITSTDFMYSESSKSALNQIMEAIKVVNMIGLHGMPGVGKTTLAKEVGKHAREQKLFDKVVMFTMSQNPDINKIQHKVAAVFDLKFRTDIEDTRAEELFRCMQRVNKILVIVDDLWEELKLETIGIPFGDDHKGCKILLTTRQQQVCSKIKCQKEIQLGILSKDEAWVLFRDQAGLEDDCSILNEVAKEVAGECKGLPLAIVTVAKALKDRSLDEWRDANQRFKDSTHLYDEVLGGVLEPLKLSYDYLKKGNNQMTGNHIHMCFLLCSLFPEDYEILLELLIICGIGLGLFPNVYSIEDKRKRIVEALKKLQKSGLLLETDGADTIRMHDVVRDFAHSLTLKGENRFMVKNKLKEWPDMVESFEYYTAIALWDCSSNIKNFPEKVEFSKLKTLFLHGEEDDLLVVSSTFFEEMKALQVLLLVNVNFSLKGFHFLPNLKTLLCTECKVENFSSSLINMRRLEILVLTETEIDEISEELVKLSTLKYLRLSGVKATMKIPPKLVSRLMSLQELHVTSNNNINLLELNSLSRLTALSLYFSTNQFSQEDFVFPKLQRYDIDVGGSTFSVREALTIRRLRIENFSSLSAFKILFCSVGKLKLNNVSGLKNIVPSIGKKALNELTFLKLNSCNDMEFLTDLTRDQGSTVVFSNLVKLKIQSLLSLKGLCYGLSPSHPAIASFTRLTVVTIESCPKLKTIFAPCLAQSMLCIEELYISSCDEVEQVIGFAQEEEITKNDSHLCYCPKLRILDIYGCRSLKYVCANTSTQELQSLESIAISDCPQLMQIFKMKQNENRQGVVVPQNHCWPKLKTFRIWVNCQILKYVFTNTLSHGFPFLMSVYLKNCPQLQAFSPTEERDVIGDHILLNVPDLQNLSVSNCPQFSCFIVKAEFMKVLVLSNVGNSRQLLNIDLPLLNEDCIVVGNHEEVFQVQGRRSFLRIKKLHLRNLFEVRIIWKDVGQVVTLENLTTLKLSGCKKLRYIFSPTTARSLSNLVDLFIEGCEEIEQLILAKDQVSSSSSNGDIGLQPISFPNLTKITITKCENLKSLFPFGSVPVLPRLERDEFDKLEWLTLEELPSLIHFCPEGCHFVLPTLIELKVSDCPKLTTDFFINSQEFVHCKTKVYILQPFNPTLFCVVITITTKCITCKLFT
ncbi:hypothetical protein ERO13_A04G018232v2 [Gossypium hirsutum]|nr:hypothetical protein ERO13_A04G018232v2 [Gossypium hirsutum]